MRTYTVRSALIVITLSLILQKMLNVSLVEND